MEALVLNKSGRGQLRDPELCLTSPTITGHAGLARHTSGDDDDLSALESRGET
jgi:hypothetical protein